MREPDFCMGGLPLEEPGWMDALWVSIPMCYWTDSPSPEFWRGDMDAEYFAYIIRVSSCIAQAPRRAEIPEQLTRERRPSRSWHKP